MPMEFTTEVAKFEGLDARVYQLHLPLPSNVSDVLLGSGHNRFICTINRRTSIHCGLMPSENYRYILINKKLAEKLSLDVGDPVEVKMSIDDSKYGMELPLEFEEVLNSDHEGSQYFEKLTPGKKRNLIYIVSSVKNTDSRITKSLAIMEHLKVTSGKLDFKQLNQLLKEYNNRNKW